MITDHAWLTTKLCEMLKKKKKKKDCRFQRKQFKIFNNDFQYETGSQKGELLSSVFSDQIPEMEVKWQDVPRSCICGDLVKECEMPNI